MTDDVQCAGCLQKGKIPLPFEFGERPGRPVFEYIGYDLAGGYLHFRCPACTAELAVSPLHLLDRGTVTGFPFRRSGGRSAELSRTPLIVLLRALAHPSL